MGDLAKIAYYVAAKNGSDMQVYAVAGDTPTECISLLSGHPSLILNPDFVVGIQLNDQTIKGHQLKARTVKRLIPNATDRLPDQTLRPR